MHRKSLKGMKNYYWYFLPFVSSLRGKKQIKRARERESSARTSFVCNSVNKHKNCTTPKWSFRCTIFIIKKNWEKRRIGRFENYKCPKENGTISGFCVDKLHNIFCLKSRKCVVVNIWKAGVACWCVCSIRRAQYILSIATIIIIESMLNQDKHLLCIDILYYVCVRCWSGHKQQTETKRHHRNRDDADSLEEEVRWNKKWIIFYDNLFVWCLEFFLSFL